MGRWTPLILMAGGLAILLGTVIGTLFPMGAQQNAKVQQTGVEKVSGVLPANINVNNSNASNSTPTNKNNRVAQTDATTGGTNSDTSTDSNTNIGQSSQTSPTSGSDNSGGNTPIRALW